MKTEEEVWVLTASDLMALNIEEFLKLDGVSSRIFKYMGEVKAMLNGKLPKAFVIDEINNNGSYDELVDMLNEKKGESRIIVLNNDGGRDSYSKATACLELPLNIGDITSAVK